MTYILSRDLLDGISDSYMLVIIHRDVRARCGSGGGMRRAGARDPRARARASIDKADERRRTVHFPFQGMILKLLANSLWTLLMHIATNTARSRYRKRIDVPRQ